MSERKVLDTIRELLRFKATTTIPEIATYAEMPKRKVLEIINRNGQYVKRYRKTGKIASINLEEPLRKQLWDSGEYYRIDSYGAWSKEGEQIIFSGHDELRGRLKSGAVIGSLGDSRTIEIVEHTEENRAAVEAAGLKPWADVVIDDRLWEE